MMQHIEFLFWVIPRLILAGIITVILMKIFEE